jgi:hypothetical protein
MKIVVLALTIGMLVATTSVSFAVTSDHQSNGFLQTSFEHGGGCRKDSPPGQCCHAGSKPYHCH